MQRMLLHLRGPIRRPLWNRLRRRLVQSSSAGVVTTAIAGGALYVAASVEPNLSGLWVDGDGTELRLFHMGSQVTAIVEENGFTSFVAHFSSSSELEGYIYLTWEDEEMRMACGNTPRADHTFAATVNQEYDVINFQWTQTSADRVTCVQTSSRVRSETLRRKRAN